MIVFLVYFSGFLVNGFVSGSIYKQSFFPRTSPGWQRVMIISASILPSMIFPFISFISHCVDHIFTPMCYLNLLQNLTFLPSSQCLDTSPYRHFHLYSMSNNWYYFWQVCCRKSTLSLSYFCSAFSCTSCCILCKPAVYLHS